MIPFDIRIVLAAPDVKPMQEQTTWANGQLNPSHPLCKVQRTSTYNSSILSEAGKCSFNPILGGSIVVTYKQNDLWLSNGGTSGSGQHTSAWSSLQRRMQINKIGIPRLRACPRKKVVSKFPTESHEIDSLTRDSTWIFEFVGLVFWVGKVSHGVAWWSSDAKIFAKFSNPSFARINHNRTFLLLHTMRFLIVHNMFQFSVTRREHETHLVKNACKSSVEENQHGVHVQE